MFLLPLLMIAIVGVAVYVVTHRRVQPASVTAHAPADASIHPFWPTTIEGKVGIAAFAVSFLPIVLVNLIQVPYLSIVTLLAAVVLTGIARFVRHDRSTAVLIALVVAALAALAGGLFLAGEVFIGHD